MNIRIDPSSLLTASSQSEHGIRQGLFSYDYIRKSNLINFTIGGLNS